MRYAVEVYFDQAAEERIRSLWRMLESEGLPPTGFFTPNYHPHISVAGFEAPALDGVTGALRKTVEAAAAPAPALSLSMLGFFLDSDRPLAVLGVTVSDALLRLHAEIMDTLRATGVEPGPYYQPLRWTPHCTLPVEPIDPGAVVSVVRRFGLPIAAEAGEVHLVELASGESAARLS
jgi:2'-5' RNA ligase superfamily